MFKEAENNFKKFLKMMKKITGEVVLELDAEKRKKVMPDLHCPSVSVVPQDPAAEYCFSDTLHLYVWLTLTFHFP